jgi:hypothetical protein
MVGGGVTPRDRRVGPPYRRGCRFGLARGKVRWAEGGIGPRRQGALSFLLFFLFSVSHFLLFKFKLISNLNFKSFDKFVFRLYGAVKVLTFGNIIIYILCKFYTLYLFLLSLLSPHPSYFQILTFRF